MHKAKRTILAAGLTVCLMAAAGIADNERSPGARPERPGPANWQLSLKQRLARILGDEGLTGTLDHARSEWARLTPDQKDQIRAQALAFLNKTPQEQDRLLEHYDQLVRMTAERREAYRRRAEWLQAVVNWLTENEPERIEQMKAMSTQQRARAMIELRDRLVREGRIAPPEPAGATTREAPAE